MTPAEYILKRRGYLLKRSKEWEQTRLIAYMVDSTKPRKGRLPRLQDWMPLPTDKFNTGSKIDEQQMQEEWEIIKKRMANN